MYIALEEHREPSHLAARLRAEPADILSVSLFSARGRVHRGGEVDHLVTIIAIIELLVYVLGVPSEWQNLARGVTI